MLERWSKFYFHPKKLLCSLPSSMRKDDILYFKILSICCRQPCREQSVAVLGKLERSPHRLYEEARSRILMRLVSSDNTWLYERAAVGRAILSSRSW